MHQPVVGDGFLKRKARGFIKACESWWVKNLLRPVFFLFPPTLITMIATRKGLEAEVENLLGKDFGGWVNGSALIILVGAYLYISLMKFIYSAVEHYSKPEKELSKSDLLAILKAINIVVGDKNKRFSDYLKRMRKLNFFDSVKTFNEITRPDQQIPLIIKSLHSTFDFIDEGNTFFRVGLMRVEKGKPSEWVAFEPASNPPRTPPDQLSAPSSTMSLAIREKSIIIVEDIQAELSKKASKKERRFIRGHTQDRENGSQLCFPIVHPSSGQVEYVISIAGNKKKSLVDGHAELYSWIIENFSTRIALEHSLLSLKEKTDVAEAA